MASRGLLRGALALSTSLGLLAGGCAEGRSTHERTNDAGPSIAIDARASEWPDARASGLDAAGGDAAGGLADAARLDAALPDAAGACTDGTQTGCTTSCGSLGSARCSGGTFGACEAPREICNGVDDDCDGRPDQTFACVLGASEACATSCGSTGARACGAGCAWSDCAPPEETCNGRDDDCDGRPDQTFACALGASGSCTTSCGSTGARACGAGCAWSDCAPPEETCNGVDDDCDGVSDEGFRARVEVTSYGALAARHAPCNGSSQRFGADCNAAIHRYCGDGCTTSGFGPVENEGPSAYVSCVIGEVRTTTYAALATYLSACDGGAGRRNNQNCNAAIHRYCAAQGFTSGFGPVENEGGNATVTCVRSAEVRRTSYTVLRGFLGSCDGSSERWGMNCNAAIHRYCMAEGFASGFGPVENDGDTAYVTCVRP